MENEDEFICVHKHELSFGLTELELSIRRRVIHVGLQDNKPYLWAIVDTNCRTEKVKVYCVGTGEMKIEHNFPWEFHIGTVHTDNGNVWHYFARE